MDRVKTAVVENCQQSAFMTCVIEAYTHVRCDICLGFGHNSSTCSTLRQLNRAFDAYGLRREWNKAKLAIFLSDMNLRRVQVREVYKQLIKHARQQQLANAA